MLLADHRPYGEAAKQLGEAFGVEMSGGFVLEDGRDRGRIVFSRDNGRLADHPITRGLSTDKPVSSITSFTGQALRLPAEFTPLMAFVKDAKRFADRRSGGTRRAAEDVSEWHQGGVAEIGEGTRCYLWRSRYVLGSSRWAGKENGHERGRSGTESTVPAQCRALARSEVFSL